MDPDLLATLTRKEQSRIAARDSARRQLTHYKSRVDELESLLHRFRAHSPEPSSDSSSSTSIPDDSDSSVLPESRLPPAGSSSESLKRLCAPPHRDTPIHFSDQSRSDSASDASPDRPPEKQTVELDVTQRRYIEQLERFADVKCGEVDLLVDRLLSHRRRMALLRQRVEPARAAAAVSVEMEKENGHFRMEIERLNAAVADFGIRHKEAKARRKTRDLQELAALRGENERRDLDFQAFVVEQLGPFMDGEFGVDEDSVRRLVTMAGELVRPSSFSSE
jgi:hypothetical protein